MNEEEPLPPLKPSAASPHYSETLLYDYSKFLTTLSLLSLGGVLSLSQTGAFERAPPHLLLGIIGAIAVGGASGFHVSSGIVSARSKGETPHRHLGRLMQFGTYAIGIGTGAFLTLFLDAIRR